MPARGWPRDSAADTDSPYLDFFELAPNGCFILDASGKIMDVNRAGARLLAMDRDALRHDDFSRYVAPDCLELFQCRLQDAGDGSGPQSYDLQIIRSDHETHRVHVDVSVQQTPDDKSVFYLTVRDERELQPAVSRPWEHNKYIRSLFAHAAGSIIVCDVSLHIAMVNPALEKLTGYVSDELVGLPVQLLLPFDCSCLRMQDERPSESPAERVTMHHVHGSVRFVAWVSMPIQAEDGETVNGILIYGQDITERIQIDQCVHFSPHALDVQMGKAVLDAGKRVKHANACFCRMVGHASDEVAGRPVASFFGTGQDDDALFSDIWAAVGREHYWQGEMYLQHGDGGFAPVLMTVSAIFDGRGQTAHYVASLLDIRQQEAIDLPQDEQQPGQLSEAVVEFGHGMAGTEDANSILKAMIRLREIESQEAKRNLLLELEQEVLPFLDKLKKISGNPRQMRLLEILEANLQRLAASHGSLVDGVSAYRSLTPKEIQVASMVREGFSTKAIAATLSISPETVSIHRKNIRRKLGLENKSDNLRSYLVAMVLSA
ncbi:MAG TPA: PAS domain S-box protein [Methylophilaceae bacterium]